MPISGSSTIHTVGAATFGHTLASSGSVTCSALLARNSGGTISGSGTLQVVGVTTLGNTLKVSGSSTFGGVATHIAHPIFDAGITIKNADASAGYINFYGRYRHRSSRR